MAFFDKVKDFMGFDSGEYDPENEGAEQNGSENISSVSQPRVLVGERKSKKNGEAASQQMQVIIVKPDHFEDVTMIADHINARRQVVLNLESANRETSRRIIDFISGVTYANHGTIKKVSGGTFMITPSGIGIGGEDLMEDYDY